MSKRPGATALEGQVVASHGPRFAVRTDGGERISCFARSRLGTIVCGDRVRVARLGAAEGVIEAVHPRTSLFFRSDHKREKAIAANATQVAIVLATAPRPNEEFIDRCLAAAEHAGVKALLVQNKIDLDPSRELQATLLARYRALGYPVVELCAHAAVAALVPMLRGETSLLIGQSGVGKSTIVNALVPDAGARTGAISRTEAGRHTTTRAELYQLDADTALIDSPGMHHFGLQHIPPAELAACFVEFRDYLGRCRFGNCRHVAEPGCAVRKAQADGLIHRERLSSYQRILRSLEATRSAPGRAEPARNGYEEDDEEP